MAKLTPNTVEEKATGLYTYRWDFDHRDFTETSTNTDQTFTLFTTAAGDQIVQAHLHLGPAFEDLSDSAFNSVTLDFGDEDLATRFFSGVQINRNGSEVIDSYMDPSSDYIYTAAKIIKVNFNSMSGKALIDLDKGKAYLEFTLVRHGAAEKNLDLTQPAYV